MKPFYITTPLYYVNARPHIGHAYTNLVCDSFARFFRFLGREVFFLTGTDEHGTKIDKAAREAGKAPKDYADAMVPQFKALWRALDIRYDFFIRTTDAEHKETVQHLLRHLSEKGDIYLGRYRGWYCTPCESFWTPLQLKEGKCPDCRRQVQALEEENYFFRLSKYQKWLISHIESHPRFILPEIRRNEISGFLREPLEDLSITRPRSRLTWGIDFPLSPNHVVYVWFDALINYVSAVGFARDPKRFNALWPADVHMVGKDILRQHAVYWPIMLRAAEVEMPQTLFAHGWWTLEGAKVSKSKGNIVDPFEVVQKYGPDPLRYFLLREVALGLDGAYSEELLAERTTHDLANDLGNLWHRTISMVEQYFNGKIPAPSEGFTQEPIQKKLKELPDRVKSFMEGFDPRGALTAIWEPLTLANRFIEEKKPWGLARDEGKRSELGNVLFILCETLATSAYLFSSFLPRTASEILKRLKLPEPRSWDEVRKGRLLVPGTSVEKGTPLFPKREERECPQK